jgi:ATP-binding cassette subfamily B protein
MTNQIPPPAAAVSNGSLPESWEGELAPVLLDGERILSWLELDLDARLRYSRGIVIATDRRLLARSPGEAMWRDWAPRRDLNLCHHDHAGVGTLELHDEKQRLARWRYTFGRHAAALRLIAQFEQQRQSAVSQQVPTLAAQALCPKCQAVLDPAQDECPSCTTELHAPPSTWTLLRLWRFA